MIPASELHYFYRPDIPQITGASVDTMEVNGEEVECITFRVKQRNRPGRDPKRKGVAKSFQLPLDHPLSVTLLELIRHEQSQEAS